MTFAAVLFDMDGVLIDTHHSVTAFWQDLARRHQVQLGEVAFAQHIYGTPATHTLAMLFPRLSVVECQDVLTDLARYEAELVYTEVNGVISLVRALKQHDIATALVTSAQPAKVNDALDQLGINGLFSATVTSNDVKQGKPNPECYLLAAQRLNKAPERCIVFEDAISGVMAAVAAGMLCIGIQQAGDASTLLQVGARYTVPDFTFISVDTSYPQDGPGRSELSLRISSDQSLPLSSD